ncbi:MAG: glycosyltransferase [Desulfovibrio sp.]|nr:glycosyltransferase [Desulfovibrio sp.]
MPNRDKKLAILEAMALGKTEEKLLAERNNPAKLRAAEDALTVLLRKNPLHVGAASALLDLEEKQDRDPGDWLRSYRCPPPIADLWFKHLFIRFAERGLAERALPLWEEHSALFSSPYTLVLAAGMYDMTGDADQALLLYRNALRDDPLLTPVRYRVAELESPLSLVPALPDSRRVMICLYSWNKAELLEKTLRSLADSDIGPSPVRILLNGCTDDSRARVEGLRSLFPRNDFGICELPVNIGAPAARNWLLALPETRACGAAAFLDDDVEVPADWLRRYLTLMDSDSRIGVVGGKIVHPSPSGRPSRMQYFHRYVSVAEPDLLKLTIRSPFDNTVDTGLYSYHRRCLNVMGCLHLLKREMLEDIGGFDLRFSPSQHDDIEHDLSAVLHGWHVVYCGTVTAVHHKMTGAGGEGGQTRASFGNSIGNDLKLSYKLSENLPALVRLSREALDATPVSP